MTVTQPSSARCRTARLAFRQSGTRDLGEIRHVVLHVTEGGTAQGVADYFASTRAAGSAHLIVDDRECWRSLPNTIIPWAAVGTNRSGVHVEHAGFGRWGFAIWRRHWRTIDRGAYKVALHCRRFGVPPYFRTADELLAGLAGVTDHRTSNEYARRLGLPGDLSHTCPGRLFPRRWYMRRVHYWYAQLAGVKRIA